MTDQKDINKDLKDDLEATDEEAESLKGGRRREVTRRRFFHPRGK